MKSFLHVLMLTIMLFSFSKASEEKVLEASNSLQLMLREHKKSIPEALVHKTKAIAIFPGITKVGFFVGGIFGEGILSIKKKESWSVPYELELKGGSLGFQFGVETGDIVLFILKENIANEILNSKFTLGVDASISAGQLGGNTSQMTDIRFSDDIYAYKINNGLFAGVSLGGAVVSGIKNGKINKDSFSNRVLIETLKKFDY